MVEKLPSHAAAGKCSRCQAYKHSISRCIYGKVPPRTIKGGIQMASVMGLGYLCPYHPNTPKVRAKISAGN